MAYRACRHFSVTCRRRLRYRQPQQQINSTAWRLSAAVGRRARSARGIGDIFSLPRLACGSRDRVICGCCSCDTHRHPQNANKQQQRRGATTIKSVRCCTALAPERIIRPVVVKRAGSSAHGHLLFRVRFSTRYCVQIFFVDAAINAKHPGYSRRKTRLSNHYA